MTLPFSNQLYPYPTTGGPGTDALNELVSEECNDGQPLADREWFTLPSEGSGLLNALVHRNSWWGAARSPDPIPVGFAFVDHENAEVISCGGAPVEVADGQPRSLVAWSDAGAVETCETSDYGCSLEPLEVFVNTTDGPPANDRWQDAKPISAVPYRTTVDTALATTDGPTLTPYCYSGIDPYDAKTVWWRFTPTVSGALPLSVRGTEDYGPPLYRPVFGPDVAIGRLTESGPVALPVDPDVDCEDPGFVEVEAGTTYLISVHDYIDPYYGGELVAGGRANLVVGALRPTAPRNVTAAPGDQEAVITWSAPEHTGSSAVTGYRIRRLPDGPTKDAPADARSFTATGLTNGTSYTFEVTAINAGGPGNPARTSEVTPAHDDRFPTEPTDVSGTIDANLRTATFAWSPPESSGASAITGYRVTRSGTDSSGDGPLSELLPATARSFTFAHLRNETRYQVTLQAVNAAGDGRAYRDEVQLFTDTPSAPRDVQAVPGTRSATVSWQPPEDRDPPITQYRVRRYLAGSTTPQATTVVDGDTTSVTVTGLSGGTSYVFDVVPVNEVGTGEPSLPTAAVTPDSGSGEPSVPATVQATQGPTTGDRGTATLTWAPPTDDGGSAITGYRVARDGTDIGGAGPWSTTLPATARSITFTHLNIWDTYTLSVQAINAVGTGAAETAQVTIEDPRPSRPTSVEAARGPRWITITWSAPEHGDQPITGYRIRRYFADTGGLSKTDTVGDVRFFNAVDVKQGRLYRFDVTAINAAGTGRPSVKTAAVSAADVPGSPTIGTATSGTAGGAITATATWEPPSSDHGSPITGYGVIAFHVNAAGDILDTTTSAIQPASARSLTMTLPVSGTYRFRVYALNEVGQGPVSAQSNKVTAR